jgi:hypothetical protein
MRAGRKVAIIDVLADGGMECVAQMVCPGATHREKVDYESRKKGSHY